jgi:hypothetical protein
MGCAYFGRVNIDISGFLATDQKRNSALHTGSCLCGGIQFQIDAELAPIKACHCEQCRKAQGTPFATNTPVASDAFRLAKGAGLLTTFESSPGKQRVFCRICGSPIYSKRDSLPTIFRVRVGLIDGLLAIETVAHCYTAHKANWWPILDKLPQCSEACTPASAATKTD